ncbi:MAG TPA: hypothetical protein VK186_20730 [Candidatus Deferrimicrobium sp.]|nr:hypothetical protein [Candidatus Deferrimicrobium sp.]
MGLKQIFKEGMQELKRKSALSKEKKNLSQKEKLLSEQLTALGKKAWDAKLDIFSFGNIKELIENAQAQIDSVNRHLVDLEKQKQDLENKKKEENETFNSQRQEVENKKKDVDNRLNIEKKLLKDTQKESDNAWNRLKQIAKEEEILNARVIAPETTNEQKNEIQVKQEALKKEKDDLEKKQAATVEMAKTIEQKIKPLEEESAAYQKEIDRIKGEQRKVIGQLDESLSKIAKEISDKKNKLAELTKEQNVHFGQLGEKLTVAQVMDAAITTELSAVNTTKKEMESLQLGIQSLENQGSVTSKSAFSKMIWLIILFVIIIVVIIVVLVKVLGPKKEPLSLLGGPGYSEKTLPGTPGEAMKKIQEATGMLKKQSEQIQGKEIKAADKAALTAALPTVNGWKIETTSYNKANLDEFEYSILEANYTDSDGKRVSVNITDTGSASVMLASLKIVLFTDLEREDDNGYEKVSTYNNMPIFEKFSKDLPSASFQFIVKDRYIVNLKCDDENGIDILKGFIAGFNFSKLP